MAFHFIAWLGLMFKATYARICLSIHESHVCANVSKSLVYIFNKRSVFKEGKISVTYY